MGKLKTGQALARANYQKGFLLFSHDLSLSFLNKWGTGFTFGNRKDTNRQLIFFYVNFFGSKFALPISPLYAPFLKAVTPCGACRCLPKLTSSLVLLVRGNLP